VTIATGRRIRPLRNQHGQYEYEAQGKDGSERGLT
jgi:hypothetical protein